MSLILTGQSMRPIFGRSKRHVVVYIVDILFLIFEPQNLRFRGQRVLEEIVESM